MFIQRTVFVVVAAIAATVSIGLAQPAASLGRVEIKQGIDRVRPAVDACHKPHPVKAIVKIAVKVAPSGAVVRAYVKEAPTDALGACVVAAVRTATFPVSASGASFSYPFRFE